MSGVKKWDAAAVCAWLTGVNGVFSKYHDGFKRQGVDGEALLALNDKALADIGVGSKLHRAKILQSVKALAAKDDADEPAAEPEAKTTRKRGRPAGKSAAVAEEKKAAAPAAAKKATRGRKKKEEPAEPEPDAEEAKKDEPEEGAAAPKTRGRRGAKAAKTEPAPAAPAPRATRGKRKAAAEPEPEPEPEKEEAKEDEAEEEEEAKPRRGRKAAKKAAPAKAAKPAAKGRGKKSSKAEAEDEPEEGAAPAPAASSSSSSTPAPAASSSSSSSSAPPKDEKPAESVEIVFSFDTTGSMYPCLTQVRNSIKETVTRLLRDIPHIRIAIVAHGDYCDKGSSYVIKSLNFTSDVKTLVDWVTNVGSTGGGDADECYELVLRDVQKLSWSPKADRKALVMIGDSNPHEPHYALNTDKINWRTEAKHLAEQNVKVYGIHALGYDHSRHFYDTISTMTGGVYLPLDQFSSVPDFVMGICFRENSNVQLHQYEQEVKTGGRMNRNVQLMFDKLAGRAPTASAVVPGDLQPVSLGRFQILNVTSRIPIKQFAEENGLIFKAGRGFYEFTKPENISVKKEVVLMEKATGDMFTGLAARKLIGLDTGASEGRLRPSTLSHYRVFVQSTSYNRVLMPGTGFLYEVDDSR